MGYYSQSSKSCTELSNLLSLAKRLLQQKRVDKNKLYSLHEPEVECIAKGKSQAKYEFGCKVTVTTTCKDPWVVSIFAAHGNPYDDHTLQRSINKTEQVTEIKIEDAFADRGYRGKESDPGVREFLFPGQSVYLWD